MGHPQGANGHQGANFALWYGLQRRIPARF